MQQQMLERVYKRLRTGKKVNLSPLLREHLKEYRELPNGEEKQVTKVTLELVGKIDPAIVASLYVDKTEIESHFYYLDQKSQLKSLLNSWLKL